MIIHNPILTGSFSVNGADLSTITGSVATSASFDARTTYLESTSSILTAASASQSVTSGSLVAASASLSATSGSLSAASGSFNTRVSALEVTGSALSSSLLTVSGSGYATSASLSTASGSFNSRVATIESKYATTGSNTFIGTQVVSGSVLQSGSFTTTGTIIAQTINVQQVTSSVVYSSGSNVFGNSLGNSQVFTGSVLITGSLTIAGASSATSYSGTTIYGSTAVCSPVGKFSTCIDAGSGTFSGCVGIGKTPSFPLDVCGFAGDTITAKFARGGSECNFYISSTNNEYVNLATEGSLRFKVGITTNCPYSSGTSAIIITSAGNVGIAACTPSTKLDVYAGSDATSNLVLWGQTIRNEGNGAATGYGAGLKLKISTDNVTNEIYKWAGIAAVAGTNYSNRTDLVLFANAGATANAIEKVRITGDGYVGINTCAPSNLLHIEASNNTTNQFRVNSCDGLTAGIRSYTTSDGPGLLINHYYAVSGVPYLRTSDFVSNQGDSAATQMRFFTKAFSANPALTMIITCGGNIGVGTGTPASKFHVNCCISGGGTATVATFGIQDSTGYGVTSPAIELIGTNIGLSFTMGKIAGINDANSGGSLAFSTGLCAGTVIERMRITNCGNVGIGYLSPVSDDGNLVVAGSVGTGQGAANTVAQINIWETTSANKAGLWFGALTNANTGVIGSRTATGNIAFQTYCGGWAERMRISYNGNVGIGTTSPGVKLQVEDSSSTSLTTLYLVNSSTAAVTTKQNNLSFRMTDTVGTRKNAFQLTAYADSAGGNIENGGLIFSGRKADNDTEFMRITTDGVFKFSSVPSNNYHLDTSTTAIAIVNGGTISFETFSGLILINNMSNGNIGMWMVGAGSTVLVSQVYGAAVGTMAYSGAINGYVWTSNSGATANYGVFAVRTRANA